MKRKSCEKKELEQKMTILRVIEVMRSQGYTAAAAIQQAGITKELYYRWRQQHGGEIVLQTRKMQELEKENLRLRKLVTDLSLENATLKDVLC